LQGKRVVYRSGQSEVAINGLLAGEHVRRVLLRECRRAKSSLRGGIDALNAEPLPEKEVASRPLRADNRSPTVGGIDTEAANAAQGLQ
jgi:hypothetical protein